jgi:hypothetical protein
MIEGKFAKQPDYLKKKLQLRWNEWLRIRYSDDAALAKAWSSLTAGEALANGTVAFAPLQAEISKMPKPRGDDLMRFLIETESNFGAEMVAFCRAQAPKGVGINVAPISLDTQYRPSATWLYSHTTGPAQASKDSGLVNSFGMYLWGLTPLADEPPGIYVMDNHTVEGMPTYIYETNQARPNRYRAEFPFRLAAMGAWQDWDAINLHYWGG